MCSKFVLQHMLTPVWCPASQDNFQRKLPGAPYPAPTQPLPSPTSCAVRKSLPRDEQG